MSNCLQIFRNLFIVRYERRDNDKLRWMAGDGFPLFAEYSIKHIKVTKYKSVQLLLDNYHSDFNRRHSGASH
jgi:hypothetical protein